MIQIQEKTINPAQVVWVSDVREIKRARPKVNKDDTKIELPPIYNFLIKVGLETLKSDDFETKVSAEEFPMAILQEVMP